MSRQKKNKEEEIFVSSGNIFAELGFSNPQEELAKSDLALQIYSIIKSRKLTQKQAAEIMGIDQPKVSDVMRGNLRQYSIDRLMRFLRLLGRDIEIRVKKPTTQTISSQLRVFGSEKPLKSRRERRPRA